LPIERQPNGIVVGHRLYSWDELDVTPNAKVKKKLEQEREPALKEAKKPDPEAEQKARLERLRSAGRPRTAPGYVYTKRGWTWHIWDAKQGRFVDTGLPPGRRGGNYPPDGICPTCGTKTD
jgi:hypothetical protein